MQRYVTSIQGVYIESGVSELGQSCTARVCAPGSPMQKHESLLQQSSANIACVGHCNNLLVPSYSVTFGEVGICALVGSCVAHVVSCVARCVDLRWGLCLAMLSVGTR